MTKRIIFICLFIALHFITKAQTTVKGKVTDSTTGEVLPFTPVMFKSTNIGTTTDENGEYTLTTTQQVSEVTCQSMGYKTFTHKIKPGATQTLDIKMAQSENLMSEVVVTNKKEHYRNKGNPAVELIRKVISHKDENKLTSSQFTYMDAYDKLKIGASQNVAEFTSLLKPFSKVLENVDTVNYKGHRIAPVLIEETWSDKFIRSNPYKTKTIIKAKKSMSLNSDLVKDNVILDNIGYLFEDVNVYENDIELVKNKFLSPISSMAPTFYKFYIYDTVVFNNKRYINMEFEPRNTTDLLLRGKLRVALDENYAISYIEMTISKFANINFVTNLDVIQEYKQTEAGKFYPFKTINRTFFKLPTTDLEMLGERVSYVRKLDQTRSIPDSVFTSPTVEEKKDATQQNDSFFAENRPVALSTAEAKSVQAIDSFRNTNYFKTLMELGATFFSGYKNFGKWELGPYYKAVSWNTQEGTRLRLGVRSNPSIYKRWFTEDYIAYGFRDKKVKFMTSFAWSFKNKEIYTYPMRYIRAVAQHDVKLPDRIFEEKLPDNLLESFNIERNRKYIYTKTYKLEYFYELPGNVLLSANAMYNNLTPLGALSYRRQRNPNDTVRNFTVMTLGGAIRWAPGEKMVANRTKRKRILSQNAPVFTLSGEVGIKGLLGADYNHQKLQLDIFKRVSLSQFGYVDVTLSASKIWGALPYPLLIIPRTNLTYWYNKKEFNLLNAAEFVSDQQVALHLDYRMKGFLFNKIPLIKRLNWREAIGLKMVYGSLGSINDPEKNPETFSFPKDRTGKPVMYTLEKMPYMEFNVGIENIFNFIKIDYIRRLTYLNHPNTTLHAVKFSFYLDF